MEISQDVYLSIGSKIGVFLLMISNFQVLLLTSLDLSNKLRSIGYTYHSSIADLSYAGIEFYFVGKYLSFFWFMASDDFHGCGGAITT